MAIAISSVSSVLVAQRGISTLRQLTGAPGVQASGAVRTVELQEGLESQRRDLSGQITLNTQQARTAIGIALAAGLSIVSALRSLRTAAAVADVDGLVGPLTSLNIGGTRLSRVNIHSQVQLALQQIDSLVEASEVGGARILSSGASDITLQTTAFGGSLRIVPQPLDTAGLGLGDLNLSDPDRVAGGLAALDQAINLAGIRVGRLEQLRDVFTNPGAFTAALNKVLNSGDFGLVTRGALVNLVA